MFLLLRPKWVKKLLLAAEETKETKQEIYRLGEKMSAVEERLNAAVVEQSQAIESLKSEVLKDVGALRDEIRQLENRTGVSTEAAERLISSIEANTVGIRGIDPVVDSPPVEGNGGEEPEAPLTPEGDEPTQPTNDSEEEGQDTSDSVDEENSEQENNQQQH